MEALSRRSLLRASGATLGASGLVGVGLLESADAASRKIKVRLTSTTVEAGRPLVLHVAESLKQPRRIRVHDTSGLVWRQVRKKKRYQMWTATPTAAGTGTITVTTRRKDGKVFRHRVGFTVTRPEISVEGTVRVGMSAPDGVWDQRAAAVGGGIAARRIFADLASGAGNQMRLIAETHAAGMLPVVSYKVGGDIAGAAAGSFNAVAEQAAAQLAAFGRPTAVTIWHEPHGDMSAAQFVAIQRQLAPVFRRGELRVGPILNGFLLDNQQSVFAGYCPDELLPLWDWIGIDTYEGGTAAAPGARKPGDRIPALRAHLGARGSSLPIGVGEYNGFSAATIAAAGEALLTTPGVWFGCLWNAEGERAIPLEGDRLAAFQATLADPRAARPA